MSSGARGTTVVVAPVPSGKGGAVHLEMFRRLLQETFRLKTKVACILDADYELRTTNDSPSSEVLKLVLPRKEIENYLICPEVLARASDELVQKRRARTRENVQVPGVAEWRAKIGEILDQRDIRDTVRYQVIPQYQGTLDRKVDRSSALERSERWFDEQWRNPDYRLRACPGKKVLAELRKWCQSAYKISLTPGTLRRAILTCPPEIKEIAMAVESNFYGY